VKSEWVALIITALTDLIISAGTALMSAMVATGSAQIPNDAVIVLALLGGIVAGARTMQQALKTTPENLARLKGSKPDSREWGQT
jgi:hypothetical protein